MGEQKDANTEVWSVEDARENWDAWVNHGGYEVSEVEDYLQGGRVNSRGESLNYRKSTATQKRRVNHITQIYDKMTKMMKE